MTLGIIFVEKMKRFMKRTKGKEIRTKYQQRTFPEVNLLVVEGKQNVGADCQGIVSKCKWCMLGLNEEQ